MIEAVELSATYEGLLKCGLITFYGKSPISFLRGATQPLVGDPPRKPTWAGQQMQEHFSFDVGLSEKRIRFSTGWCPLVLLVGL